MLLIEIGDVATDALIESLDHEKVNVRCDATRALGEIGNKKLLIKSSICYMTNGLT